MVRHLRLIALGAVAASALALTAPLEAQNYFGRNKVQYDDFDWNILETPNFDIHFYERMDGTIGDFARMSERWYERFARSFQHEFEQAKPLIVYADHPDFQQTNTLRGQITEGTGGVTESLKNRVIMPMTGSYADTDHVLGHELIHAFQYNIAQSGGAAGFRGLVSLPLWLIEGMAEYLSVGREDALTAMWLRDAVRRDDFPTIRQLTTDTRFFPYRFGQALWAYVGGTYGDDAIYSVFRRSLQVGFRPAITQVLGVDADTLSAQWRRSVEAQYGPLLEGRDAPADIGGTLLLTAENAGDQNIAPSLSPDGTRLAFISEKDLFSFELFLADAETGEIIRKLTSSTQDPHADAIRFIDAAGTWSPDGERFAYVTFAQGDNEINVIESDDGDLIERLQFDGIGAINNVDWSPDGRHLAFNGLTGGVSDLYVYDMETEQLRQLTDDLHADMHPTWSPDGSTIAFASDRGPETDFETLVYSRFQIATVDVATGNVQVLDLLGDVRHSNPQFSPDGNRIIFLSDADGFSDVYATDLRTRAIQRLTRVATGVSGITAMSPALSVARASGRIAVSVFDEFGFQIHTLPADTRGEPLAVAVAEGGTWQGRALPPAERHRFDRVATYLDDPDTGLVPEGTYTAEQAEPYESELTLDFLGQPSIGIGTGDRFGNYVGGGASAFFSDMLGNELLGVAIQAQGQLKDIGGQVVYGDLSDRLNWQVGAARIPTLFFQSGFTNEGGVEGFVQRRWRIYSNTLSTQLSYPLSQTRRLEFGVSASRFDYDIEEDRYEFINGFLTPVAFRESRPDLEPDAINLGQLSVAWVGDNTINGFVGPIRGGRFRLELEQSFLDESFVTAIADWRRYISPTRNLTFAMRGLHYGRYGDIDSGQGDFRQVRAVQPLFLGYETLIRGYASESFTVEECVAGSGGGGQFSSCAPFERLFGQRIAVANLEARVPLLGVEQYGLIAFPFIPTELGAFVDAGVAYDTPSDVDFEWTTNPGGRRVPVVSTGLTARMNILGVLILEAYYAY
ncbi:MAG TPA: BamA/TamA family outer membrane protein, partial [Longimicrobiales bacterium]|nr:BamA/TamA family outer membrane protein [Longimicrobiales bacterium]